MEEVLLLCTLYQLFLRDTTHLQSHLSSFIDVKVTVPGCGEITVDISYGGALYAFVNAEIFGLDVNKSRTRDLVDAATAVTNAVKAQVQQTPDTFA